MTALTVLIPVAIIGFIFLAVVSVRQRAVEPVTVATATSFYAYILAIVPATLAPADVIVLAVRLGSMSPAEGVEGLSALEQTGRIASELAGAYREQLQ
jgi:hypothetical protein